MSLAQLFPRYGLFNKLSVSNLNVVESFAQKHAVFLPELSQTAEDSEKRRRKSTFFIKKI